MKESILLLSTLVLSGCSLFHGTNDTQKYYSTLIGNTYYQISNEDMLEKGDTMVFRFTDSTYIESGYSRLLYTRDRLNNNSKYQIDCSTKPCSLTKKYIFFDSTGTVQFDPKHLPEKGIIEVLTDSTFRIRFNTGRMHERPTDFRPEDHPDVVTFERKN